jgi:hypothetical protein
MFQRLHLIVFLGVVAIKAGASTWAQSMPPELRYQASDVDPDSACLAGTVPTSSTEHANRERFIFHTLVDGRGPISLLEPQFRDYSLQAGLMERAAPSAETLYQTALEKLSSISK